MYADVVLPVPLPGLFTYALPPHLASYAQAGCRVIVPFGAKKRSVGLIVRLHDSYPEGIEVKVVEDIIDQQPVVLTTQLELWQWIADYYICTIGEVYKAAMPKKTAAKNINNTHIATKLQDTRHDSAYTVPVGFADGASPLNLPQLSTAQSATLDEIYKQWESHNVCLLHGVTASGKTEIYIHLIAQAVRRGQQVLYLLPEIVLTSQLTQRLRAVFGERLGVYHSKYSERQRADVYQRQLTQHPFDIIVGVRSAVFLPFQHLGLVIVDEEHEVNFKQQDPAPRYNARNVAIIMATRAGAHTILGTATPSFESYYNARRGKYGIVHLTQRYGQVQLPQIQVVDIRELRRKHLMQGAFSPQLVHAIRQTLDSHQQVILFHNRRGYAPHLYCHVCAWVPRCPHCDVTLTLHKRRQRMTCHYCGYNTDIPLQCPACHNPDLRNHGFGTERIQDDIERLFPQARVARMDLDTTRTRNAYERLIDDFAQQRTDILVGTQMVTKGLDFQHVSVVGILSADTMLHQPDFRAYERSFSMMSQVAGRAGRRQHRGLVILQTMDAQLPLIRQIVDGDYDGAYTAQMIERRTYAYPPFTRIIVAYLKHRSYTTVEALAREATLMLRRHFGSRVLGPDEPPVARIASLFIRRVIIKLETSIPLSHARRLLLDTRNTLLDYPLYASAHIYFDMDPL